MKLAFYLNPDEGQLRGLEARVTCVCSISVMGAPHANSALRVACVNRVTHLKQYNICPIYLTEIALQIFTRKCNVQDF